MHDWTGRLLQQRLLHDEQGPRLVQAVVGLPVRLRWLQLWFGFRQWLKDLLHLSHGFEVVGHPDPPLATRRLEDALAEEADLLVLLHLLPQSLQEAADLLEVSSLNFIGEGTVHETADIGALLGVLGEYGGAGGGVEGEGGQLDLTEHPIPVGCDELVCRQNR